MANGEYATHSSRRSRRLNAFGRTVHARAFSMLVVLAIAGGCGTGAALRRGATAERRGQYEAAYELYCQAARRSPTSGDAAAGLARVTNKAARGWELKARGCMERGSYDLAWRLYMYVLEVRPDHPTAARTVRTLEREHPDEIARARRAWLSDGAAALVRNLPQLALSDSTAEALAMEDEGASSAADEVAVASPREEPVALDRATETPPRSITPPKPPPAAPVEPTGANSTVATPPPAAEPRAPTTYREFLTAAIISRADRRFGRSVEIVDGIQVRLRDVSAGPAADVDILVGARRVARRTGWNPDDSLFVRGESGRRYELVLLAVIEPTQTIRFGVRRAE